jgi:hypothetical protein
LKASPDTPLELVGVRNLSRSGVGLVMNRNLDPGKVATLNLFNSQRNFATRVLMRVVYGNAQKDATFWIGAAFMHEMGEEEVHWLR